jgi:RNA polymerase sigma factor (sigma-70 family)
MTANDRALAEDLIHDLFIVFTLSQPDLSHIENLDSYLHTSLRNLHISHLRRATRGRFEQLSMVEYESARLSLQLTHHGRERTQAQDELRRICHYACVRKSTAHAASVLILRFFHGYYPSEIARIMHSTAQAVDVRLRAARMEAKAYLANPGSLKFINTQTLVPEILPARFTRNTGDFLIELQQRIFDSVEGECLNRAQLEGLYLPGAQTPIARKHLAHIVCCPTCLDAVNRQLGLAPLAERYPTDTMDKDNKKGGGGSAGGTKSANIRRSITEWEREAREAFEHKPQELCVSVNGYLLGSQLIGAELSELTLNVTTDDRISFCEVFSEQGIRLLIMNVEGAPPNGPGELRQRLDLSGARSLEACLRFSNPFPTLHVSYHDPALATATSLQEDETEGVQSIPDVSLDQIRKVSFKEIAVLVREQLKRWFNASFLRRPAVVTAVVVILLASTAWLLYDRQTTSAPLATELLRQSTVAEEAMASDSSQVLHRTIELEERNEIGESISRRRIEVWQTAELGISARRLYDEKGVLLAGDWRRGERGQILYGHGVRPQIKSGSGSAALTFETVWRVLPSAKELNSLVGGSAQLTVEERPTDFLISYYSPDQSQSGLLKATLVLNRADLHATSQTLTVRQGSTVREYDMREANFEIRSRSTIPPTVFEPEVELLGSIVSRPTPAAGNGAKVSTPIAPSAALATPALEIEALRLLNEVGADMGEQIVVTRTTAGLLQIEGLTETEQRKQQLLNALRPVVGNPAIKVDIQTLDEALARQARNPGPSGPVSIETTQPSSNLLPVDKELRQYFASRAVPEAQTEEAIRQFAERAIRRSLQVLKHASALRGLAQRFPPAELQKLDVDTKGKWLGLIRQHARGLQQESSALHRDLAPVFPALAEEKVAEVAKMESDADLEAGIQRLYLICAENDRIVRLAFSISPDSARDSSISTERFWRSLQTAENLATKISEADIEKK